MRLERFERPTDGFEARCSIQLSYKREQDERFLTTDFFLGKKKMAAPLVRTGFTARLPSENVAWVRRSCARRLWRGVSCLQAITARARVVGCWRRETWIGRQVPTRSLVGRVQT